MREYTECVLVLVTDIHSISDKALRLTSYDDDKEYIIPKSCWFALGYEKKYCEAHWISKWIADKEGIQYKRKVRVMHRYDKGTFKDKEVVEIVHHYAESIEPVDDNLIEDLKKTSLKQKE